MSHQIEIQVQQSRPCWQSHSSHYFWRLEREVGRQGLCQLVKDWPNGQALKCLATDFLIFMDDSAAVMTLLAVSQSPIFVESGLLPSVLMFYSFSTLIYFWYHIYIYILGHVFTQFSTSVWRNSISSKRKKKKVKKDRVPSAACIGVVYLVTLLDFVNFQQAWSLFGGFVRVHLGLG